MNPGLAFTRVLPMLARHRYFVCVCVCACSPEYVSVFTPVINLGARNSAIARRDLRIEHRNSVSKPAGVVSGTSKRPLLNEREGSEEVCGDLLNTHLTFCFPTRIKYINRVSTSFA